MTTHLRRAIPLLAVALALLDAQKASAQAAPPLGVIQQFSVLGGSGVTGNGGMVTGDVGSFPTCPITGFPVPTSVVPPFILHGPVVCDATVAAARGAATTAFIALNQVGTAIPDQLNAQFLGPGVYTLGAGDLQTAGGLLTLTGGAGSIYVFRTTSTLTINTGSSVNFGAVNPCNVYWQVGSSAIVNSTFIGQIFAGANITLGVGVNLTGRAIAGTAAVIMSGANNVGGCAVAAAGPPPVPPGPPGPPTPPVPTMPDFAAAGLVGLLLITGTFILGRR